MGVNSARAAPAEIADRAGGQGHDPKGQGRAKHADLHEDAAVYVAISFAACFFIDETSENS